MTDLHVVFLPFMAYGHMIPMADMAVLFASHGLQTTLITTPSYAPRFSKSIQKTTNYNHQIALHILQFNTPLPIDNFDQLQADEFSSKVYDFISMFQEPVEQFIQESRPHCIIADMFYPWTTKTAAKFNIPRIVFHGSGFFPMCVSAAITIYDPARTVSSDSEPFIVPHLPHQIKLTRKQLPDLQSDAFKPFLRVLIESMEAELTSYGVIFNSFFELEPEYVRHYREVMKRKAWHVGPVSLCNMDKFNRGKKSGIDEHECLKWLDSKASDSVVYISFGTIVNVTTPQLYELAIGLETCNESFIWVINNGQQVLLPEGFETRMKASGKGLIIKGWAPQLLILDHDSVGGFVTHCGWNSLLEGISCGVAMVTWPVMAEQFNNAKLVTEVLRIGVSIGEVEWSATSSCKGVKREVIEKAVARVMGAEEGKEMRSRARVLKEKATAAVEEGGSSYLDLKAFIEDIKTFK